MWKDAVKSNLSTSKHLIVTTYALHWDIRRLQTPRYATINMVPANANAALSHPQKIYSVTIPVCLHNTSIWDGNKNLYIGRALQEADITSEEFYACWREKVNSLTKTERGKKQLVALLKRGGFHISFPGSRLAQLRQRIAFVNEVVGRETSHPGSPSILTPRAQVCKQPYIFHYAIALTITKIML